MATMTISLAHHKSYSISMTGNKHMSLTCMARSKTLEASCNSSVHEDLS